MEFFNIGNFIVLAVLGTAMVAMRRFDQQNRTVDGVKRFLDKAKKEFDEHVIQSQERFFEMSTSLENFEKTSREALRRIEEDSRAIGLEAENLNEVKGLVMQMLAEKEAVSDAIENLKKDSSYVVKINDKIEQTAAKALAVEEASERLLGELVDRNQKAMDGQKEVFLSNIEQESKAIRASMAEQSAAAEALKAELNQILAQKEMALVASLKVFNAELERIQSIYADHLKAIEAGAKAMESEGLRQVKDNIDDQFEKVKNLTASLFNQETMRFREKLEIQVNEFDVFAEKYRNMESALSERFELLNTNVIRMESDYNHFNDQMRDLSGYMEQQFAVEAADIKDRVIKESARVARELENSSRAQLDGAMQQLADQFDQVDLINDNINEKLVAIEASYQHKEDQLNANMDELTTKLELMQQQLFDNFTEAEQKQSSGLINLEQALSHQKNQIEQQIIEQQQQLELLSAKQQQLLEEKLKEQGSLIESEINGLHQGISQQKSVIDQQFKSYQEAIGQTINDEKRQWSNQLALLKDSFNEMIQSSKGMVDSEIENMLLASLAEVKGETEDKIKALTAEWSKTISQSEAMAKALTDKESNFEEQLLGKIVELDQYYNQVIDDLRAKQRGTEEAYQQWDETIDQLSHLVEDELAHEKNSLKADVNQKINETERALKDEWAEKISNFSVMFDRQVEEANALLRQKITTLGLEADQLRNDHGQKLEEMGSAVKALDLKLRAEADELNSSLQQKALVAENQSNAIANSYENRMKEHFEQWQESALALKASYEERALKANSHLDELAEAWENRFNTLNIEFKVKSAEAQTYAELVATEWKAQYEALKQQVEERLDTIDQLGERFSQSSTSNFTALEQLANEKSNQVTMLITDAEIKWQERLNSFSDELDGFQRKSLADQQAKEQEWQQQFEEWRLSVAQVWAEEQKRLTEKSDGAEATVKSLQEMIDFTLQQADSKTKEIEQRWMQRFDSFEQDYDKQNESALRLADELKNSWNEQYKKLESSITERFTHAFDALNSKIDEKSDGVEHLYDEKHGELVSTVEKLEHLYSEKHAVAEALTAGLEQEWQLRYEQLNDRYSQMVATIEQSWQEKSDDFATQSLEQQAKIDAYMAMIDDYYQTKKATLDRLLEEQLAELSGYGAVLTGEQQQQLTSLREQWQAGREELNLEYQQKLAEVATLIDESRQKIELKADALTHEAMAKIDDLTQTMESLDTKINEHSLATEEAMQQRYNLFKENMENSLVTVWDDFKALRDDYSQRFTELEQLSATKQQDVSGKIDEHQALLARRLAELDVAIERHVAQSDERRSTLLAELDEHLAQLGLEADQKIDLSRIKQDDITRHWQSRFTELDALHQKSLAEALQAIDKLKAEWLTRLDGTNQELFERIDVVNGGIDERLAQVDVRAELVEGAWAERYERYSDNLAKRLEKTENEIEHALGDWRTRLDGLQGDLDERLGEANRLADEVAGRWRKSFEELQDAMAERAKATQQQVDELERLWGERFADAQTLITSRLDESKNWSRDIEERWMTEYQNLEQNLSLKAKELDDALGHLTLQSKDQFSQFEQDFNGQIEQINKLWQGRLTTMEEELTNQGLAIREGKDDLGEAWAERFTALKEHATEQLRLAEEESGLIEEGWRKRFAHLNQDVEEWITTADQAAKEQAEALEALWAERFSTMTDDETKRAAQAETYAKEIEQFWQSKVALMNEELDERLNGVQAEAKDYLAQLSDNWQERVNEAQHQLEQQLEEAAFSSSKVEERWQEQYQQLIEKFGEHTKGTDRFAEQLNDQWKKRYGDLNHTFEEQSKQMMAKTIELDDAKASIDHKIAEFKELTITEMEAHRAQMQSQLTEQLIMLGNEMRGDWEERLGDLKTTFAQRIEQSKEAATSLEESRNLLDQEKNLFSNQLEKMASEALMLYEQGKERLNGAFEGFEDHLTSWQLNFTSELRRLEDEAILRQNELKTLNQTIDSDFSLFETSLNSQQEEINQSISQMKRDLDEDRYLISRDNRAELEAVVAQFQKVGSQIEAHQAELDELLALKKSDATALADYFSKQLDGLISQQHDLFNNKLASEASLTEELTNDFRQQQQQLELSYQQRIAELEASWQQVTARLAEKEHEINATINQSKLKTEEQVAKVDATIAESIELVQQQVLKANSLVTESRENAKAQAEALTQALTDEQLLRDQEAKARLAAIDQNWQEIEHTIISQQELYQGRIEQRLAALEKESNSLSLNSEVQLKAIRDLANGIEQDLIAQGNQLRSHLAEGLDGADTIIADYHQTLESYKQQLQERMHQQMSSVDEQWQKLLEETKNEALGQQHILKQQIDEAQQNLSAQQNDLNRQIVAMEQGAADVAYSALQQQEQLDRLYNDEKASFEQMALRRTEENERRWANLTADLDEKEVLYHKKIEQSMVLLRTKTDELNNFYDGEKEKLHQSFEDRLNEINQAWLGFNERLGMKQNDFEQDFAGRVEIAEHRLTSLEDRLNLKQESFEASFGERLASSIENLKAVQTEFDRKQHDFDQSLASQIERASQSLVSLEQDFKEKRVIFEQALADRIAGAGAQVDQLTAGYQAKHEQFEERFEERLKATMSEVEALEDEVGRRTDALKGAVDEGLSGAKEQLEQLSSSLMASGQAIFAELESRLSADRMTFNGRLESVEENVAHRTANLDRLFEEIQHDFTTKKSHFDAIITSNQDKLLMATEAISLQRDTILSDLSIFKTEMGDFMAEKDEQLRLLISEQSSDVQEKVSKMVFAQFEEADRRLHSIVTLLDHHEKETDAKLVSYRNQFLNDFSSVEELIGQAEFELNRKRTDFEEGRRSLESQMNVYRDSISSDLHRSEEELRALINSSITQTGEDLSLEFMGTLESRLSDYEEAMKGKLSRMESFISDVDVLEASLRASMSEVQGTILNEMGNFENDIRLRHERELERAASMLSSAQQEISNTIHNAQGSIGELKLQVDDLRRKALENVTGQLTEFEEGFLGEINKREEVIGFRMREWQSRIEQGMDNFEKRKLAERNEFEEKFGFEQENTVRRLEERIESEFSNFSNQISSFATDLERRTKETELEVNSLRETLSAKMDFFVSQADDQMASRLLLLQQELNSHIGQAENQLHTSMSDLKSRFDQEKDQLESTLKGYHSDIEIWRTRGDRAVGEHEEQFNQRFEQLNELFKDKMDQFNQQLTQLNGHAEALISEASKSFTNQTNALVGVSEDERRRLRSDFDALSGRATTIEGSIEKKASSYLDKLSQSGDELLVTIDRKGKQAHQQIEDRLKELKGETKTLESDLIMLRNSMQQSINEGANQLASRLEQIEKRQQAFEVNTPIFKQAEEMREALERALVDLSERMAKVEGRREEVIQLESQLGKAFKINESLAEKLSSMARERTRFDEMDGRIAHVMDLSEAVDQKLAQITSATATLQEVQARLRNLEEYERGLQTKFENLDKRAVIAESTSAGISKNFDLMQQLEGQINQALAEYQQMSSQLEQSRASLQEVGAQQPRIDYLLEFFQGADQKLVDMEDKVTRIDQMRDWMVAAENRFTNLQDDIKSNMRALAVGSSLKEDKSRDGVKESGDVDINEMVVKLALQSWGPEQIASHLKLSIAQVTLILDRHRGK